MSVLGCSLIYGSRVHFPRLRSDPPRPKGAYAKSVASSAASGDLIEDSMSKGQELVGWPKKGPVVAHELNGPMLR